MNSVFSASESVYFYIHFLQWTLFTPNCLFCFSIIIEVIWFEKTNSLLSMQAVIQLMVAYHNFESYQVSSVVLNIESVLSSDVKYNLVLPR